MNQLKTATTVIQKGYGRNNLLEMIKALEFPNVFNELRQVQKDELQRIKTKYFRKRCLAANYKQYLIDLHFNFVLNNFKFEDNKKVVNKSQHIGLQMLNQLQ